MPTDTLPNSAESLSPSDIEQTVPSQSLPPPVQYVRWRDLWGNPARSDSHRAVASTATWFHSANAAVVRVASARQLGLVHIPRLHDESAAATDHEDPDSSAGREIPPNNRHAPTLR